MIKRKDKPLIINGSFDHLANANFMDCLSVRQSIDPKKRFLSSEKSSKINRFRCIPVYETAPTSSAVKIKFEIISAATKITREEETKKKTWKHSKNYYAQELAGYIYQNRNKAIEESKSRRVAIMFVIDYNEATKSKYDHFENTCEFIRSFSRAQGISRLEVPLLIVFDNFPGMSHKKWTYKMNRYEKARLAVTFKNLWLEKNLMYFRKARIEEMCRIIDVSRLNECAKNHSWFKIVFTSSWLSHEFCYKVVQELANKARIIKEIPTT